MLHGICTSIEYKTVINWYIITQVNVFATDVVKRTKLFIFLKDNSESPI